MVLKLCCILQPRWELLKTLGLMLYPRPIKSGSAGEIQAYGVLKAPQVIPAFSQV